MPTIGKILTFRKKENLEESLLRGFINWPTRIRTLDDGVRVRCLTAWRWANVVSTNAIIHKRYVCVNTFFCFFQKNFIDTFYLRKQHNFFIYNTIDCRIAPLKSCCSISVFNYSFFNLFFSFKWNQNCHSHIHCILAF